MAKKKTSADEKEEPVVNAIDPCWCRYPDREVSYCDVSIWLGGAGFTRNAEVTRKEEYETKDLMALKRERITAALDAVTKAALESLHG